MTDRLFFNDSAGKSGFSLKLRMRLLLLRLELVLCYAAEASPSCSLIESGDPRLSVKSVSFMSS